MNKEDRILIHSAMENLASSSMKAAKAISQTAEKAKALAKEIERNDLFEKWLESLDVPLMDWQKEILRVACTQPHKKLYISMPKGYGRQMTLNLIEQYKQMIKGEKEMDKWTLNEAKLIKEDGKYYITTTYTHETDTDIREVVVKKVPLPLNDRPDVEKRTNGLYFNNKRGCFDTSRYIVDLGYGKLYVPDRNAPEELYVEEVVEEKLKEMTLEEIEQKLGFQVKIVKKKHPIKSIELCEKCKYSGTKCFREDCTRCPMYRLDSSKNSYRPCKCIDINEGDPCPYFKEAK
jgi:hypothetical protein